MSKLSTRGAMDAGQHLRTISLRYIAAN